MSNQPEVPVSCWERLETSHVSQLPLTWDKAGLRLVVLKHSKDEVTHSGIHACVTLGSKGSTGVRQDPGSRTRSPLVRFTQSLFSRAHNQAQQDLCAASGLQPVCWGASTNLTGPILNFSASSNTLWPNKKKMYYN